MPWGSRSFEAALPRSSKRSSLQTKEPLLEDPGAALRENGSSRRSLLQLLGVEDSPVVDVVQINSARVAGAVVGHAGGGEDALAGLVVMDVAADVGVVAVDVCFGQLDARVGGDPGFTLRVGGLAVLDEGVEVIPLDAEIVGRELVITAADGVVGVDFASCVKGGLQPDTGEVKNTEGAGDAGGDHGDDLAHGMSKGGVGGLGFDPAVHSTRFGRNYACLGCLVTLGSGQAAGKVFRCWLDYFAISMRNLPDLVKMSWAKTDSLVCMRSVFFPKASMLRAYLLQPLNLSLLLAGGMTAFLTTGRVSVQAGEGGDLSSIAAAEIQRRMAKVSEAEMQLHEADVMLQSGKYEAALGIYSSLYQSLPDAPLAQAAKDRAREGYAVSAAFRAKELALEGRYKEANELLTAVSAPEVAPHHRLVEKVKKELGDTDRFPPALTPQHITNTKGVQDLLQKAASLLELGDFDKAIDTYKDVLRIDGYNVAARRGMESAEQKRAIYFDAARDHTRSKMLNGVNGLWADQVPPNAAALARFAQQTEDARGTLVGNRERIQQRLRDIIIPKVEFTGASLQEVVEYLRIRSRDLDPQGRGVDFVLALTPDAQAKPLDLNLHDIPLEEVVRYVAETSNSTTRIDEFAVRFVSITEGSTEIISKTYRVPPGFIETAPVQDVPAANPDPFATGNTAPGANLSLHRLTAQEFLAGRGITFPPGASAAYSPASNLLIVRNTMDNMGMVDALIEQAETAGPKQVIITVKMIQVRQTDLVEMGFDWLMGGFNVPGSNGIFGSGGTAGNGRSGNLADDFPIQNFAGLPVGQFPVTSGLRSSGEILGKPKLEGLLGENITVPPAESRSPGVFAVSGVLTDPQFQAVIRAMNQKKGADVLISPSVVAKTGQKATIDVAREFLYPTEFDPPELPQSVGFLDAGRQISAGNNLAPITPSTPTAFEMRKVGVTLEVEPVISENGREVDLVLTPALTEFEGFIDYASDINNFLPGTSPSGATIMLPQPVDNRIIQPIFQSNKVTTGVKIWDGATIVLGGVMYEQAIEVNDKVPIIGDIPIIGRFWKSNVTSVDRKNVIFFVNVRVINPAGQPVNQLHAEGVGGAQ